jgi:vesicle coat complex subunit
MGYIRVEKMVEHISAPLKKALKDADPYVRKAAAISVAKVYDINQNAVEEHGLIGLLIELLSDSNAVVVSNAVAALTEIGMSNENAHFFKRFPNTVNKLLNAINECSE